MAGLSLFACWPYWLFTYSVWLLLGVKKDIEDVLGDKHAEQEMEKHRSFRAGAIGDNRALLCDIHSDLDVQPWRWLADLLHAIAQRAMYPKSFRR